MHQSAYNGKHASPQIPLQMRTAKSTCTPGSTHITGSSNIYSTPRAPSTNGNVLLPPSKLDSNQSAPRAVGRSPTLWEAIFGGGWTSDSDIERLLMATCVLCQAVASGVQTESRSLDVLPLTRCLAKKNSSAQASPKTTRQNLSWDGDACSDHASN